MKILDEAVVTVLPGSCHMPSCLGASELMTENVNWKETLQPVNRGCGVFCLSHEKVTKTNLKFCKDFEVSYVKKGRRCQ